MLPNTLSMDVVPKKSQKYILQVVSYLKNGHEKCQKNITTFSSKDRRFSNFSLKVNNF